MSAAVDKAVQFRESFGLTSSRSYVLAAESNETLSRTYGVSLTDAEQAAIDLRVDVQQRSEHMVEYLQDQSEIFAGIYLDRTDGSVVTVVLTKRDSAVEKRALELAAPGANVTFVLGDVTLGELTTLKSDVDQSREELAKAGIEITSTWVDPVADKVGIGVDGLSNDVRQSLLQQFGEHAFVVAEDPFVQAACNNRFDCGSPMKGGLQISAPNPHYCTSAFNGRTSDPFHYYVVTAGHCIQNEGLSHIWSHHGVALGPGVFESDYQGSSADAGLIQDSESGTRNRVMANDKNDVRSMTTEAIDSEFFVNGIACRAGQATPPPNDYFCGQITKLDYSPTNGGVLFNHQYEVNFPSTNGDSGGTFMVNQELLGLLAGTNGVRSNFSTMHWIWWETGVDPCLDAACDPL